MAGPADEYRALSARFPADVYEALRAVAGMSGSSMNEVVVRAVRAYLLATADNDDLATLIEETRTRISTTLEKLRVAEEESPTTRAGRRKRGSSS